MSATILVVEDEPAIQALIEVNLRRAGHVLLAADAETARRLVRDALPDLVLLDWMLPGMSGIDFARLLRSEARTRRLPIIMLTARAGERDKIEGARTWRRRLRHQALQSARTGGADQGRAAPARAPGDRGRGRARRFAPGSGDPPRYRRRRGN
jgi:CheY-like chemotaxis protein